MTNEHTHENGNGHSHDNGHDQDDDFSLAYLDSHDGLTLLLIHGFPLSSGMWQAQMDELRDEVRVIAPDLRGHGHSDAPPAPYAIADFAEDLAGLMDHLAIHGPFVVCGLSMGGYIALEFYRQFPEHVAGLVLVATRAGADSAEGKAGRDKAVQTAQEKGVTAVTDAMLPKLFSPETVKTNPELVEAIGELMAMTSEEGMVGALQAMRDRIDSTPMLPDIDVPTLIIHGADDQLIPKSEAEAMAAAIPDADLEIIPEAGHLPNLEQEDIFNEILYDFIEDVRAMLDEDSLS